MVEMVASYGMLPWDWRRLAKILAGKRGQPPVVNPREALRGGRGGYGGRGDRDGVRPDGGGVDGSGLAAVSALPVPSLEGG